MEKPQNPVFLTVCVSCRARPVFLKQNLKALKNQTLDKSLWSAALLFRGPRAPDFLKTSLDMSGLTGKILVLPAERPVHELRNLALRQIKSPVLFFIDEDVILENPRHLQNLVQLHKKHLELDVLGGGYLSSKDCSFWGRVYNWISRLWVSENPGFSPAGNLSVKTARLNSACRFKSPLKGGFGGEEIYFFNQIKKAGLQFACKPELDASHLARHTFKDLFDRALLHGQSRAVSRALSFQSVRRFLQEPESFAVKICGGFYLCLVYLTAKWIQGRRRASSRTPAS